MKITKIKASSGRTFNHPNEQFSNFRHHVELHAELQDGDDYYSCTKNLQTQADILAEEKKQEKLGFLKEEWDKQFRSPNNSTDDTIPY